MVPTKYDFSFPKSIVKSDINRLTNQLWKLIPMKENNENWKKQINQVLIEIVGLQNLFENKIDLLIIISKLEGLREYDLDFKDFRSLVFSVITLLSETNERII